MKKKPFNEIKVTLKNLILGQSHYNKSKVFRIEVCLHDSNGMVKDTFYRAIGDYNYQFQHTFESFIYPLDNAQALIPMSESFYVRIPTNCTEDLKNINLIFLVQTLENIKNSDEKVIKFKRVSESLS
jgi:hypothetical protein